MEKKKKKPSMLTMIKNFAKDSAEFIKQGAPMCSEEEFEARMNTCRACPEVTDEDKCGICGCYMPVKAGWKTTECPADPKKWGKLIGDDEGRMMTEQLYNRGDAKDAPKPDEIMQISGSSRKTQGNIRRAHIDKLKGKKGAHSQK